MGHPPISFNSLILLEIWDHYLQEDKKRQVHTFCLRKA